MADKEQLYHVTYLIRPYPDGLPKSRIVEGEGACDDVIIHSIIRPDEGGLSHMVLSCNGRKGEPLAAADQWQIWALWAANLMEQEDLDDGRRMLCQMVHEMVRDAVLRAGEEGSDGDTD